MAKRALEPDVQGFIHRDGIAVAYETFGEGGEHSDRWVVFPPIDPTVHGRVWKAQVPFLSRHARVVVIDPRGNGRSDRPTDPAAYADDELVADVLQVMDELHIDKALFVGICNSAWISLVVAARRPERVAGIVTLAAKLPRLGDVAPWRDVFPLVEPLDTAGHEGWAKENIPYWLESRDNYRDYAEFFADQMLPEPHSTKLYEDFLGWSLETTAEVRAASSTARRCVKDAAETTALLEQVHCPVLAIHGQLDACMTVDHTRRLGAITGAEVIEVEGGGHLLPGREPVFVNTTIRGLLDRVLPVPVAPRRWQRAMNRPKKVLYLSSPIGLGHAARDVAIVAELRKQVPGVQVDWLAQHPVTEVLARHGERIHPASAWLASESAHVEAAAGEHRLDVFQSIREMDETLVANFHVFDDLVAEQPYDLWVGDEAWDLDYFLHENPERKRAPYVWMTDFVGWVPMPEGGDREAVLTADYNAEMIEQIARYPRLRDRSVFVGNPQDCVDLPLGPGLPGIREWTEQHYTFSGHVLGSIPEPADREALRRRLGHRPGDKVCVVTVGGSGVGLPLLRRMLETWPLAKEAVPELRMTIVTGPRIDPAALGVAAQDGLTVTGYLPDLNDHLVACDLAVVQGGLTTTMDLVAAGRPFLFLPLQGHFEQNVHVPHRLAQYGGGVRVDWRDAAPAALADLIKANIGSDVSYRPVETDGAVRAAALLAEML
jgi:pimeloyl-ACP methyl ester carboxylesterase/predicted glycosyltransferase